MAGERPGARRPAAQSGMNGRSWPTGGNPASVEVKHGKWHEICA
jgi:hypothetical protein